MSRPQQEKSTFDVNFGKLAERLDECSRETEQLKPVFRNGCELCPVRLKCEYLISELTEDVNLNMWQYILFYYCFEGLREAKNETNKV